MAYRTRFTDRRKAHFLAKLRDTGNVTEACKEAGISRRAAYDHRHADTEFGRRWAEAEEEAIDSLEREAWRRAKEGVVEPVFYRGVVCGQVRRYSDRMLELLLKAHRPEKYRERLSNEQTGMERQPVRIAAAAASLVSMSDEEVAQLYDEFIRSAAGPGEPDRTSAIPGRKRSPG